MAKSANQKLKLLVLQEALLAKTDEDHPISVQEMIELLAKREIKAERKSIYSDMTTLEEFGLDVQSRKGAGYFVGQRMFELPELKLLVDAVQSSRFISKKKSGALIGKLKSLASVEQAKDLERQVHVDHRVKTMNEKVYYSIDVINSAINDRCAVTFHYFDYNVAKEKVYRHHKQVYAVEPKGLIWDSQKYYLVAVDLTNNELRHYRVDKMDDVTLGAKLKSTMKESFDLANYENKHFSMFSGDAGQVRLRVDNNPAMVGVILDRFGYDVSLVPEGNEYFTVSVEAVVSPQFCGWVFGLDGQVEVVAPTSAVETWKKQLEKFKER